jgi:hypothetical protein
MNINTGATLLGTVSMTGPFAARGKLLNLDLAYIHRSPPPD